VPRWISGWALVAVVPYLADAVLVMFDVLDVSSPIHATLVVPMAVNEMVLAIWLLAKGLALAVAGGGHQVGSHDLLSPHAFSQDGIARDRIREGKPLDLITPKVAQYGQSGQVLYAFGRHEQAESVRKLDGTTDQDGVPGILGEVLDERPIDLQARPR
jgi:hypothetical protein